MTVSTNLKQLWERCCTNVMFTLVLGLGTTACAQTPHVDAPAVFEARAASTTAKLNWIKKEVAGQGSVMYVAPQAVLTNSDVSGATARSDALGRSLVVLDLKSTSGIKLMALSARQENTHIAIMMNNVVIATVAAKGPMTGHRLAIEGFTSEADARRLADQFNALVQ